MCIIRNPHPLSKAVNGKIISQAIMRHKKISKLYFQGTADHWHLNQQRIIAMSLPYHIDGQLLLPLLLFSKCYINYTHLPTKTINKTLVQKSSRNLSLLFWQLMICSNNTDSVLLLTFQVNCGLVNMHKLVSFCIVLYT